MKMKMKMKMKEESVRGGYFGLCTSSFNFSLPPRSSTDVSILFGPAF